MLVEVNTNSADTATWVFITFPIRRKTPTSSASASTAATATVVVGGTTASTPIAIRSPATTPTRRATDRASAPNGLSRRTNRGTNAA